MQIIIISSNNSTHKHWHLSLREILLSICLIVIAFLAIITSFNIGIKTSPKFSNSPSSVPVNQKKVAEILVNESTALVVTESQNVEVITQDYYAQRLGKLQAESIRLRALTEKIAKTAGVDIGPFVLEEDSPRGGLNIFGIRLSKRSFQEELEQLSGILKRQNENLAVLQNIYLTNENIESAIPQGFPLKGGWISSYYGDRIDPFTGKKVFHKGVDITGKRGSKILSVADGIISWTGKRTGYGQLVEINHGNGYITRYAHNKELMVKIGERVRKGQPIAIMGSTGRSTGPHVHFELLRDGKIINPHSFIKNKT